jgi:hypothetical protein
MRKMAKARGRVMNRRQCMVRGRSLVLGIRDGHVNMYTSAELSYSTAM